MTLTAGDIHYLIKTLYRLDLTTVHVNALRWVIKLTLCWKQTQTCVVLKYRLGYHEKQPVSQRRCLAVTLEGSFPAAGDPLTCLPVHRGEHIFHCQTIPAFCFPLPLTLRLQIYLFSPCVHRAPQEAMSYRRSLVLWHVTSLPVICTTACNVLQPTFLSCV